MAKPVLIFDWDDTLATRHFRWNIKNGLYQRLFPHVDEMIPLLHRAGYTLAIASYNAHVGEQLRKHNLLHLFSSVYGYLSHDKVPHLTYVIKTLGVAPDQVIFFDDKLENIETAASINIPAYHVNKKTGITLMEITQAVVDNGFNI